MAGGGEVVRETTETRTGPVEHPSLPLPRLQLRWTVDDPAEPDAATCHYELAFALRDSDQRTGDLDGPGQHTVTSLGPQGPSFSFRKESFLLPAAYAARSAGQPRRSSG